MVRQRKNIVLIGIGHTNVYVLREWARDPIPGCTLTCVSTFPTATYSGMLPGTLAMQFADDEMRIDLESLADRAGAALILADVNGLDLQTGEIHFSDHESIAFDFLSIGVGSMPSGWQQHSHSTMLVPVKPMQTLLRRLDDHLKATQKPQHPHRVAIVGGGAAGIEIACCLQQKFREENPDCGSSIEIFTAGDHAADGMSDRSVRRIEKILATRGIAVRAGERVIEVGDTSIVTEDGQRQQFDCVIWATGAAPPTVLAKLGLETDDHGFIATSDTLQTLSDSRIFAVGDAGTIVASPSPKAGVYAVRQGPILWHNLRAMVQRRPLKKFAPQSDFLKILNTGDGKALLQYGWLTAHARWCWTLKTWIDKRFVREFQE